MTPLRKSIIRQCDRARRQGQRIGLRTAHTLVNEARRYQAGRAKSTSVKDPDLKGEHEFSANTLHAICLKLQEEIKRTGKN